MQSRVILELARMGPCIIVGRCADAVLRAAGQKAGWAILLQSFPSFKIVSSYLFLLRLKCCRYDKGTDREGKIKRVPKVCPQLNKKSKGPPLGKSGPPSQLT